MFFSRPFLCCSLWFLVCMVLCFYCVFHIMRKYHIALLLRRDGALREARIIKGRAFTVGTSYCCSIPLETWNQCVWRHHRQQQHSSTNSWSSGVDTMYSFFSPRT